MLFLPSWVLFCFVFLSLGPHILGWPRIHYVVWAGPMLLVTLLPKCWESVPDLHTILRVTLNFFINAEQDVTCSCVLSLESDVVGLQDQSGGRLLREQRKSEAAGLE